MRALARSLVHGDADADDLMQDTAIAAMTSPPDSSRPVRPWLATVLRNRWRMDRRSRARRMAREEAVVFELKKIELVGIGVKLVADGETILVEQVVRNGGAAAAGIVAGDHIVAVDMIPVTTLGLDGAVGRVRGVAGTKLSVSLQRGDKIETLVVERKPLQF